MAVYNTIQMRESKYPVLLDALNKAGITVKQIAEDWDKSEGTVRGTLKGDVNLTIERILYFSNKTGVDYKKLFPKLSEEEMRQFVVFFEFFGQ